RSGHWRVLKSVGCAGAFLNPPNGGFFRARFPLISSQVRQHARKETTARRRSGMGIGSPRLRQLVRSTLALAFVCLAWAPQALADGLVSDAPAAVAAAVPAVTPTEPAAVPQPAAAAPAVVTAVETVRAASTQAATQTQPAVQTVHQAARDSAPVAAHVVRHASATAAAVQPDVAGVVQA